MKKYSLILLAAAALFTAGCDNPSAKKSPATAAQKAPAAYEADYEQIWLPTPKPAAAADSEGYAPDLRFVLDERVALLDANGSQIGEIFEGTPVKLLSEKNGIANVEITGKVNDKSLAFTSAGEFLYATFTSEPKEHMNVYIAAKSLTASHDDAFDAVETFYYDSCTSCHAAHAPHEHAIGDWDAYIGAMQMNAKITDEQKDRILRFMQAHAEGGQFKAN